MKIVAVLTPPSIYHGCSTQKTFWEEKFTGKENVFLSVGMKNCGRHNVRKQKEIRGSDRYVSVKKKRRSGVVTSMSPSKSHQSLTVWTR